MKRTVRLLIVGLVLTAMLVSILPQAALAAPKWGEKPGKGPKIKFKDIEKNWARNYIEQLTLAGILKGISDDKFSPEESVESVQVLVMLVRAKVKDWETKVLVYQQDKDTIRNMSGIPAWARGYVRVALDEKLITKEELANLRPGQKATRLDVAKYISRLFDEDDDWWEDFDFTGLRDLEDLPDSLKAYIALVAKKGLMVGTPEGRWLPHNLLNRGQLAKIFSLILSRLGNRPEAGTYVYGEVVKVQPETNTKDASITIKTKQDTYTYKVADDCVIYVDGKSTEYLEDVTRGQRARLTLAGSGSAQEVVYIYAETPKESEIEVTGTISGLTLGQGAAITVKTDTGRTITFEIDEETDISLDGRDVFRSSLKLGQMVTVTGRQEGKANIAIEIAAESIQEEVSGEIRSVVTQKPWSLSLEDDKGRTHTFRITVRTTIRLNNRSAVLDELQPEDEVKVWATDGEALRVEAEREEPAEREIEGKIAARVLGDEANITVRTKGGSEYTYDVTEHTTIRLDNKPAVLEELETGWRVELKVKGDEALYIWAESPEDEERTIEGKLVQIRYGSQDWVTIEDDNGRQREFKVDKDARFFLDDEEVELAELDIGLEVELTVRGGIVYEIWAED